MHLRKTTLIAALVLVPGLAGLQAQVTNAVATVNGSANSLSPGVQSVQIANAAAIGSVNSSVPAEPYDISVVTGINDANNITLDFVVSQNPETDFLDLKIPGEINQGGVTTGGVTSGGVTTGGVTVETRCIASLQNINGNILHTQPVKTYETTFPMKTYPQGTYFISVANAKTQKVIKSFVVIKQ